METNNNIESKVDRTIESAKEIKQVDLPVLFTEKTMQRINSAKSVPVVSTYLFLKVAAILILVGINAYTISRLLESPVQQTETVKVSMDDLVKDYQVTDVSNDWLNNKTTQNEQP